MLRILWTDLCYSVNRAVVMALAGGSASHGTSRAAGAWGRFLRAHEPAIQDQSALLFFHAG